MTKKQLIATAEALQQPPVQAAQEYEEKREQMAARIATMRPCLPPTALMCWSKPSFGSFAHTGPMAFN